MLQAAVADKSALAFDGMYSSQMMTMCVFFLKLHTIFS